MLVVMVVLELHLILPGPELSMLAAVVAVRIQREELAVLAVQEMVEQPLLAQPQELQTLEVAEAGYVLRGLRHQAAPVS
jgi:hypothetical protein